MKLLQYCKLQRNSDESTEDWISYLRIKANECSDKEHDRQL